MSSRTSLSLSVGERGTLSETSGGKRRSAPVPASPSPRLFFDHTSSSSTDDPHDEIHVFSGVSADNEHDDHVRVDISSEHSHSETDEDADVNDDEILSLKPKPWYKNVNQMKLIVMLTLTSLYFVAELLVGFFTGSLALVSDAFHMASDSIALIIAFVAIQWGKRGQDVRYSFGWQRSELIGSFVNGVFLLSVCVFIVMESIKRFIEIEPVKNPLLVVYVSVGGLGVNIIGLIMFSVGGGGHGHSHGGSHGHSHDAKTSHKKHKKLPKAKSETGIDVGEEELSELEVGGQKKKMTDSNMKAVFLHILGDFLGSIAAILSGLLIYFLEFAERYYFDPILSLIIVAILLVTTVPLVRRSIRVFMQTTPPLTDIDQLQKELLSIPGVIQIHEMHIWTLTGSKNIGSLHITTLKNYDFMKLASKMKNVLHSYGVHSTTIQPEFVDVKTLKRKHEKCQLSCKVACVTEACCPPAVQEPYHDQEIQELLLTRTESDSYSHHSHQAIRKTKK